jgi:hypothetical protein
MAADPETLALLKLLALGEGDIEAGRAQPARDVLRRLRGKAARATRPDK